MTDGDRLKIGTWWSRAGEGNNMALGADFSGVLGQFPTDARQRFLALNPGVVNLDGALGKVRLLHCKYQIFGPSREFFGTEPHRLPVICLTPRAAEQTPRGLHYLVAHEIAHLVLGHLHEQHRRTEEEREAEVDTYLDSLGFERPHHAEEHDDHGRLAWVRDDLHHVLTWILGGCTEENRERVVAVLQTVIHVLDITLRGFEAKATRCPAPDVEAPLVAAAPVNGQGVSVPRQPVAPRPVLQPFAPRVPAPRVPRTPLRPRGQSA